MATLIERDESTRSGFDDAAIDRIARQRGVTRRTVLRWRRGETQPSNRTRELTRRQALRRGRAQAQQVRSADGTFQAEGTIATGGSIRAVESINRNLRRTRAAEIERARRSGNERALAAARARPTRLTREEAADIALRRERLVDTVGSGESPREPEEMEFFDGIDDVIDDWESWRNDYEERSG
tara:strand:- start:6478 stop:7026 length:549 start_codon:yes stop_codon:yes gene_type:complete